MKYRKLSPSGDYVFGAGGSLYHDGVEAVAQAVLTRLRLLKAEWWEDLGQGLPLWQDILGSRDRDLVDRLIKKRIEDTAHVRGILFFESRFRNDTRVYDFTCVIDTDYGEAHLEEVNLVGI